MSAVPVADPRSRRLREDLGFKPIPSPVYPVGYQPPAPVYEDVGAGHLVLAGD
jgi:peptide/nickel transport system ATP-binding protein/glutathione transport system ATP-binding protein